MIRQLAPSMRVAILSARRVISKGPPMERTSLLLCALLCFAPSSSTLAASLAFDRPETRAFAPTAGTLGGKALEGYIVLAQATVWDDLIRLDVGDLADRDTRPVSRSKKYHGVRVCAEENKVRIRRAEVMLDNNRWQRLFLPLALAPGECSKEIEILGGPRKLRAVQFDYEAFSEGYDRATLVVQGRPELEK
jgi:hypothetical protein